MNDPINLLHEIDRYLNREMAVEEAAAFEALYRSDPAIKEQVDEQARFRRLMENHAGRKALKEKLETVHARVAASLREAEAEPPARVISIHQPLWKTMLAAAAMALLVAAGFFAITHDYDDSTKDSSYVILRREIDNIRRSQNALINNINTSNIPADPGSFGGTGFAVSSDGYIATNSHVIENADSIYIQNNKGEAFKTSVVFKDPFSDLAILKVTDSAFVLPALPYTLTPRPADIGEEVYTLGFPKDDIVYGKGYISAETGYRGDTSAYQVALSVNPGNSGGPLLDGHGNVVGIVSGKQTSSDDIAFAVKSGFLKDMLEALPGEAFNRKCSILSKSGNGLRLNRVDQIKKLQDYLFIVKVYN